MIVWCEHCQKEAFSYRTVPHDGGRIIRATCHGMRDEFTLSKVKMEDLKGTIVGFMLFGKQKGVLTKFPERATIEVRDGVDKDNNDGRGEVPAGKPESLPS